MITYLCNAFNSILFVLQVDRRDFNRINIHALIISSTDIVFLSSASILKYSRGRIRGLLHIEVVEITCTSICGPDEFNLRHRQRRNEPKEILIVEPRKVKRKSV